MSWITKKARYNLISGDRKLFIALLREQHACAGFVTIPTQRPAHLLEKYHLSIVSIHKLGCKFPFLKEKNSWVLQPSMNWLYLKSQLLCLCKALRENTVFPWDFCRSSHLIFCVSYALTHCWSWCIGKSSADQLHSAWGLHWSCPELAQEWMKKLFFLRFPLRPPYHQGPSTHIWRA